MNKIKEKNFISAVVYVNNCEAEISSFLDMVHSVLDENFEKFEIICVNDACTDKSVQAIKNKAKNFENGVLSIINMSYYQGLEMAMNAGIDLAIGDFVFEFDKTYVDYAPSVMMDVYYQSLNGYDIVAASNSRRRFMSNIFYNIYRRGVRSQYKLSSESFRVISRRGINRVNSMNKILPYRKAVYSNCGLRLYSLVYESMANSNNHYEKKQLQKHGETAINSLMLFTNVAYKSAFSLTIFMMALTLIIAAYVLVVFVSKRPVAGFTTMMLVMTGCFFCVFAVLTVVLKYLSLIVELIFKKQQYIIESVEKVVS